MLRNSDNVLHTQMNQPPLQRLVYNGIELIPVEPSTMFQPRHAWHIPGGAIMTTSFLCSLAKQKDVVIKIIDYTKRPL